LHPRAPTLKISRRRDGGNSGYFAERVESVPAISRDPAFMTTFLGAIGKSSARKLVGLRYFQDVGYFLSKGLTRRV